MPEPCPVCNFTSGVVKKLGKYGCGLCYQIFGIPANLSSNRPLQLLKKDFLLENFLDKQLAENTYNRCLKYSKSYILNYFKNENTSIRFRVLRNIHKEKYRYSQKMHDFLKKFLLENFCEFRPQIKTEKLISMDNNRVQVTLFDEDHLRFEWYGWETGNSLHIYKKLKKLETFDYLPQYGYLSACPTNLGRGDKISILLDLSKLYSIDGGSFLSKLENRPASGWKSESRMPVIDKNNTKILFYIKNANSYRKGIFLRYVFFLSCLNRAIRT